LYLLKERSEESSVIELFFNEIKNQFSTSIHVHRTDNVLEYVKKDASIFCSKNEIIHQTLVLIHPNKMELLNANTFWNIYGVMLC